MKIRLRDKVAHWFWRRAYNGFGNCYYLDRFKEKGDIQDIERFLRFSSNIQDDVEELICDGYYYAYMCDGEFRHAHSLKSLYMDIVHTLMDNPDVEFKFPDDDWYTVYSDVDRVVLDKLIRKIRELVKEQK